MYMHICNIHYDHQPTSVLNTAHVQHRSGHGEPCLTEPRFVPFLGLVLFHFLPPLSSHTRSSGFRWFL